MPDRIYKVIMVLVTVMMFVGLVGYANSRPDLEKRSQEQVALLRGNLNASMIQGASPKPTTKINYYQRGRKLFWEGCYRAAIQDLQQCRGGWGLYQLGCAYERTGQATRAAEAYAKVIRLGTPLIAADACHNLARVQAAQQH